MSKENDKTRQVAEALAKHLEDVVMPYDLADEIIDLVLANGKNSREQVMTMLAQFGLKAVEKYKSNENVIKEAVSYKN